MTLSQIHTWAQIPSEFFSKLSSSEEFCLDLAVSWKWYSNILNMNHQTAYLDAKAEEFYLTRVQAWYIIITFDYHNYALMVNCLFNSKGYRGRWINLVCEPSGELAPLLSDDQRPRFHQLGRLFSLHLDATFMVSSSGHSLHHSYVCHRIC